MNLNFCMPNIYKYVLCSRRNIELMKGNIRCGQLGTLTIAHTTRLYSYYAEKNAIKAKVATRRVTDRSFLFLFFDSKSARTHGVNHDLSELAFPPPSPVGVLGKGDREKGRPLYSPRHRLSS